MATTAFYAGVLGIWLLVLSVRVIGARRSQGVSLGHADNAVLERRIRAQANFAEYAPLTLLLLALLESMTGPGWWLHVIGLMLLAGRLFHGWAFSFTAQNMRARVGGMIMTFSALGLAAAANVVVALIQ